jgi:hypothetical protein
MGSGGKFIIHPLALATVSYNAGEDLVATLPMGGEISRKVERETFWWIAGQPHRPFGAE